MSKTDPLYSVIKKFRENAGLRQQDVAARAGLSTRTIQRIESGKLDMKVSQYRKICKALELSDMDVTLALFDHEYVQASDVVATAQRLPPAVRNVLMTFVIDLAEALKNGNK